MFVEGRFLIPTKVSEEHASAINSNNQENKFPWLIKISSNNIFDYIEWDEHTEKNYYSGIVSTINSLRSGGYLVIGKVMWIGNKIEDVCTISITETGNIEIERLTLDVTS